jgi:ornithine cyclodeaminase/alanine dehydrogenase-like protein (mu-crystallin family)
MTLPVTRILTDGEVRRLLPLDQCIAAVEAAFRLRAGGEAPAPPVVGWHAERGGFHLKSGALLGARHYFAAKLNANFPGNPERGLPTIQGVLALFDADDGRLLAMMASGELTRLRTAAAPAVAARHLARPESSVLSIFGCGRQSLAQIESVAQVLPLQTIYAYDPRAQAAERLVSSLRARAGLSAGAVDWEGMSACAPLSDVIVTCSPSTSAFLTPAHVAPGTFIAAVGADDAAKQEIDPAVLAGATVVVDRLEQCVAIGDLHHAIAAGMLRAEDVHAELGEVVAGTRPGRRSAAEITLFDSTGCAWQDVAAAAVVYEGAERLGSGVALTLGAGQ